MRTMSELWIGFVVPGIKMNSCLIIVSHGCTSYVLSFGLCKCADWRNESFHVGFILGHQCRCHVMTGPKQNTPLEARSLLLSSPPQSSLKRKLPGLTFTRRPPSLNTSTADGFSCTEPIGPQSTSQDRTHETLGRIQESVFSSVL